MANKGYAKAKGRSDAKSGGQFIMTRYDIFDSPAYRSLSPNARCAIMEVQRRYNGSNNGHISFSYREMGERLGKDKNTGGKALNDLVKVGFLKITENSDFNRKTKKARRYAITFVKRNDNKQPTNEWKKYGLE